MVEIFIVSEIFSKVIEGKLSIMNNLGSYRFVAAIPFRKSTTAGGLDVLIKLYL